MACDPVLLDRHDNLEAALWRALEVVTAARPHLAHTGAYTRDQNALLDQAHAAELKAWSMLDSAIMSSAHKQEAA